MVAQPLGAASVRFDEVTESMRNAMLRLTQLFNLTGHPAVSIPMGRGRSSGLPCGLQVVGVRGATDALMRVALSCEETLAAAGVS
jgi:aspartyl-tRNA(Asn)/glutamyl-tRNA(Gln) amidotransferase subunit A